MTLIPRKCVFGLWGRKEEGPEVSSGVRRARTVWLLVYLIASKHFEIWPNKSWRRPSGKIVLDDSFFSLKIFEHFRLRSVEANVVGSHNSFVILEECVPAKDSVDE